MTTFNSTFDWNSNLPPSISALDENDFLLLLQKQFPAVNASPIAPGILTKGKPDAGTDPKTLNKFQMPNTTSPLSTDSSPSPPSANDDNGSLNGSDGNLRGAGTNDEEHHKRKASADDFDDEINEQPSAKSQHMDRSKKITQARRKSAGGEKSQDESRLLKRKEQNRAAQRAFRERKEKHVKDLEDKVAQLEAKTESQATENGNLRDLLSRLQNENVMLKQATFTFSMPSSSTNAPKQSRDSSRSPSDSLNLYASNSGAGPSRVPDSAGSSVATASTHDSPSSLFEGFDSFSPDAPIASTSAPNTSIHTSTSDQDLDTMAFFGSTGPFTTISSNPMFTSYRDPVQSMNAFASFGGWDGDVSMTGPSSSLDNSNAGLEDLFGDQFSGLIPFSSGSEYLTGEGKSSPSLPTNGLSPVGHPKPGTPPSSKGGCPKTKEDVERMIASGPKGTFGDSPVLGEEGHSPGTSTIVRRNSDETDYDTLFQQALGKTHTPKAVYSCDNFNIDELCLEMQRKAKCSFTGATCS